MHFPEHAVPEMIAEEEEEYEEECENVCREDVFMLALTVATNLMARFSYGGMVRGKADAVRPVWFPYINIACMVTKLKGPPLIL